LEIFPPGILPPAIFSSEIPPSEALTPEDPRKGGVGRGRHVGMAPNTHFFLWAHEHENAIASEPGAPPAPTPIPQRVHPRGVTYDRTALSGDDAHLRKLDPKGSEREFERKPPERCLGGVGEKLVQREQGGAQGGNATPEGTLPPGRPSGCPGGSVGAPRRVPRRARVKIAVGRRACTPMQPRTRTRDRARTRTRTRTRSRA